jgi:hypothetical protein
MPRLLTVALVLFAGCAPTPSDKPGPFNAQELAMSIGDQEEQHLEEAAAHPFWQVPVRAAQVGDLTKKMQADQGDAVFLIDDHSQIVVQRGGDVQDAGSGRRIKVNLGDYSARLNRIRQLMELNAK